MYIIIIIIVYTHRSGTVSGQVVVTAATAATCVSDGVARRCAVFVYCCSYTGMYYAVVKKEKEKKAEYMVTCDGCERTRMYIHNIMMY